MYAIKIKGSILFELICSLSILIIITPLTIKQIKMNNDMNSQIIHSYQESIEASERHYQLYIDTMDFSEYLDDCCFKTQSNIICYDIKNKKFRRRKKKFSSRRFYTTYLGNIKQWQSCECDFNGDTFNIQLKVDDYGHINYIFNVL